MAFIGYYYSCTVACGRSGWLQQHLTKSGAETTATESFAIAAREAFIPADQSTVVVTHAWSLELVALWLANSCLTWHHHLFCIHTNKYQQIKKTEWTQKIIKNKCVTCVLVLREREREWVTRSQDNYKQQQEKPKWFPGHGYNLLLHCKCN